jgi:hypothetical protein
MAPNAVTHHLLPAAPISGLRRPNKRGRDEFFVRRIGSLAVKALPRTERERPKAKIARNGQATGTRINRDALIFVP